MTYWIFFFASCIFFIFRRLRRYLRYLQQEEYNSKRFLHWFWSKRAFDRKGSLVVGIAGLAFPFFPDFSLFFAALLLVGISLWEPNPITTGKLRLVITPRARRIYTVALSILFSLEVIITSFGGSFWWVSQIALFQLLPAILCASVILLALDERRRQRKLLTEAKKLWAEVSPYVIGITGSYGKTSTKDALGSIMQVVLGATFWPRKGINTPMGITREIRTRLRKGTPYAVVEMGAYGPGSIKRLCDLTPPHAGIITGIGIAHLDRFGDQETILRAKSELAQAIPYDGILVCNGDNYGARRIAAENTKKQTLLYGFDNKSSKLDCWISSYAATPKGSRFEFQWKGGKFEGETPLWGRPAVSNVAAAFTMACALGAQPEFVLAAITLLKPVDNRLEVHKDKEITYLRDAYNSNPEGFTSALEVLSAIPAKRRILMTPGMIELANQLDAEHERIGRRAAEMCDLAILVGSTNSESLSRGLRSGGMPQEMICQVETRDQAFHELHSRLRAGDAVLIENDLPDLYEMQEKF